MCSHPNRDLLARFFSKVHVDPGGCWRWTSTTNRSGYGVFGISRRGQSAHRVAYEWFVGPIGFRLQLDHLCRVRNCVNPSHLEPVTAGENIRRARGTTARYAEQLAQMAGAPTHPGAVFLEDFLEYTNYNISTAAHAMGMSINRLSEIVLGKRAVTPATALVFEKFSGVPADFWLRMQLQYDLWHVLKYVDVTKIPTAKKYDTTKAERAAAKAS